MQYVFCNMQCAGQIYPSAFPEMLRVVRPGGYILIAMKVAKKTSLNIMIKPDEDNDWFSCRTVTTRRAPGLP